MLSRASSSIWRVFQLTIATESVRSLREDECVGRGAALRAGGSDWGLGEFTTFIITPNLSPVNDIDFLPELCYIVRELD